MPWDLLLFACAIAGAAILGVTVCLVIGLWLGYRLARFRSPMPDALGQLWELFRADEQSAATTGAAQQPTEDQATGRLFGRRNGKRAEPERKDDKKRAKV